VGLSGGVDSVVLTDLLARLAPRFRIALSAVHVNHQLSPNAARWARFCRTFCRARGIPLRVAKVTVPRGDSIEAAARAARHEVFRTLRTEYVALAHNQDDQVETLLLQLLRGAGVKGLAAMPAVGALNSARAGPFGRAQDSPVEARPSTPLPLRSGRTEVTVRAERSETKSKRERSAVVLRPLLDVPRSEIEAYARKRGLEWVEDESNEETWFLRNFLRHEILPAIARRYPGYRATLARSARHFADAAQLLDDLARIDAAESIEDGALRIEALRGLGAARARNLLRHFLATHGVTLPADRLDEALRQLLTARRDARVSIAVGEARLRRFADRLHIVRDDRPATGETVEWHGERKIVLPGDRGVLEFRRGRQGGISLARLRDGTVTIGVRHGGERLKPDCRRPRRSLKNLLQEARIPPWQRSRTPLVFCDGELVWAAGIGVDCAYQAVPGEPAVTPAWRMAP